MASQVMFLYRDDYYDEESENKDLLEVIVSKNRHGERGTVLVSYAKQYGRISNIDWSSKN